MKVLFREPGRIPEVREIDGSLESLQELVGGWIEHVHLAPGLGMLVDEEGKLKGLDENFYFFKYGDQIVGPVVFVGEDGENFTDISEKDIDMLMTFFNVIRPVLLGGDE